MMADNLFFSVISFFFHPVYVTHFVKNITGNSYVAYFVDLKKS